MFAGDPLCFLHAYSVQASTTPRFPWGVSTQNPPGFGTFSRGRAPHTNLPQNQYITSVPTQSALQPPQTCTHSVGNPRVFRVPVVAWQTHSHQCYNHESHRQQQSYAQSCCMLFAGDLLCFLHADTQPPKEMVAVVRGVMDNSKNVLGGFRTIIQTDGKRLHGMTLHHLVKTYYIAALLRPLAFVR